jgi:L-arabinose isomerase
MTSIELVAIDGETTIAAFRKELRWNQVYYHLAGGL